jgi:biopolymer transport protein ExbD
VARKRRQTSLQAGELNLTAMIDVAFQLLSFFLVTSHPVGVMVHLNVSLPSPGAALSPTQRAPNLFRVKILPDGGLEMNGNPTTPEEFNSAATQLAKLDREMNVMILCTPDSPHRRLIDVLDLCSKVGLTALSIISTN